MKPYAVGKYQKDNTPTVIDAEGKVVCLVFGGVYLATLIANLLNERRYFPEPK